MKNTILLIEKYNYSHLFASRFLFYVISSHNVSKSMAFVSGDVQKHFDSPHFDRHSASSSWSLPNLITCLSMQALAESSSCDKSFSLDTLECSHT